MKKYLPIKVHHIYFGYGWWWGSKVYFRDRIYGGIFIVPLAKECQNMGYAHNGKLIGHGMVMSWEQSRQREAYGNCANDVDLSDAFEEGAKWMQDTMIDKATKWLFKNVYDYFNPEDQERVESFRKYLEE